MKQTLQFVWAGAGAWLVATLAVATTTTFDPYQVIINRAIFGTTRTISAPPGAPTAIDPQAAALARKITMCAVNRTPAGTTAVGFIDHDAKPPRNIYLHVGDSSDGYTILAADYDSETATITKDDITITLQLGKGLLGVGLLTPSATTTIATDLTATDPDTPPPPPPPNFVAATDQLLAMIATTPVGSTVPPLPIAPDNDLTTDAATALATDIYVNDGDSDTLIAQKESVAWAKVDMRTHVEQTGDTPASFIKQLEERHNAEAKRRQEARAAAEAELIALTQELTAQEIAKRRAELNEWLLENEIEPLEE